MSGIKRCMANRKEDEVDDEFDYLVVLMMGKYQKRLHQLSSGHRGSVPGHRTINRDKEDGHNRLYQDYFAENPTYPENIFRQRFRMRRSLFNRIKAAVEEKDPYFVQKRNAAGILGLSCLQKVTSAFRQLAYGVPADTVDEYIRIGESTAIESIRKFVKSVCEVFGDEYLRPPNESDTARLLHIGEQCGFPGMLGSIDCMHWKWKNCPTAWQGMYSGHVHEPTIILEAVASTDLWIWHAFFGLPGSHNDINVLHRSPLFDRLAEGQALAVNYTINGHKYNMGYYLADGIYPNWSTFVKIIKAPPSAKTKHFATMQEAQRKDVERAFGVLQARFAIVRGPARFWDEETLRDIMKACIIMHNMIIEDERDVDGLDMPYDDNDANVTNVVSREGTSNFSKFVSNHKKIRDPEVHDQLQQDLIEHLWERHG